MPETLTLETEHGAVATVQDVPLARSGLDPAQDRRRRSPRPHLLRSRRRSPPAGVGRHSSQVGVGRDHLQGLLDPDAITPAGGVQGLAERRDVAVGAASRSRPSCHFGR
jgi:hypothetical protein